tara:strand:+ start:311 stop:538 length:228 start_codon:yes stop_codon:yes gene_type:complete
MAIVIKDKLKANCATPRETSKSLVIAGTEGIYNCIATGPAAVTEIKVIKKGIEFLLFIIIFLTKTKYLKLNLMLI